MNNNRHNLSPILLWILLILAVVIASGENIKPKPYLITQEINCGTVRSGDAITVTLNVSGTIKNFVTDSERIKVRNTGTSLVAVIATDQVKGQVKNDVYVTAEKDYRFIIKMQVAP